MLLLSLILAACDFSAATEVEGDETGTADTGDSGAGETGDSDSSDSGDDTGPGPEETDDDGDGWAEVDGDCDDTDPSVFPGAEDACDGVDSDCDGDADEDAWKDDPYEPNDDREYDLGSLSDDPSWSIEATLHDDGDVDRFSFTTEDSGWSLFSLDVALGSIPDDATYRLVVENVTTGKVYYSDYGSDSLVAEIDDTVFDDEAGTWRVTVDSLGGATCAHAYLLTIVFSD